MKTFTRVVMLAAVLSVPFTTAQAKGAVTPRASLVEVADYATNFQTFLSLASSVGLIGQLSNPIRQVTLLAPTDEAFAKLPKGMLERLKDPRNRDELKTFVENHIVPGAILSASFAQDALTLPTQAGATVRLSGKTAGGANIESADVITSTGVMHVVDQVILPKTS